MSITTGFASSRASASLITGENSVSVSNTLASPWRSMNAIVSGSRRMFSAFNTAPAIGTPKWTSNASGMLGAITATVSPLAIGHCEAVGVDGGAAQQETNRRQRHIVGRVLVEADFVRVSVLRAHRRRPSGPSLQEMRSARRQPEPAVHRL